jgi:hypothetical protein
MAKETEEPIEMSDEMLEAIRILRSDGHTQRLEELKESHAAIIERLDREAEERSNAKGAPEPQGGTGNPPVPPVGTPVGTPEGQPNSPVGPQPPPKIETPAEPEPKAGKIPWWERDNYRKD